MEAQPCNYRGAHPDIAVYARYDGACSGLTIAMTPCNTAHTPANLCFRYTVPCFVPIEAIVGSTTPPKCTEASDEKRRHLTFLRTEPELPQCLSMSDFLAGQCPLSALPWHNIARSAAYRRSQDRKSWITAMEVT